MITAAWIIVAIVALIVVGPTLLDILDAQTRAARRESARTLPEVHHPAWLWYLAIGLSALAVVLVVLSYFGAFGLSS